jgi:CDP-diacylglycerol--serine O-phosphatidyltransferase
LQNMDEPINRSERAKRSLLRTVRRQRLKYITVLPSLITLINGACGFAAIVFASKAGQQVDLAGLDVYQSHFPFFSMACYMIFFAMLADMIDGHLARISQNTSSFGGQLDSLCDVISFGVAPAFLMLRVVENGVTFSPAFDIFVYRFLWLTAAIYIGCAAIRLARFNVENEEDEANHMSFWGLPTPAAAGVLTSLIILNQDIVKKINESQTFFSYMGHNIIIGTLPFVALGVSVLMVSRIRYSHILNQYLRGRKPFAYLIRAIAFIVIIMFSFEVALVLVFCSFALSGFLKWFYYRVIVHKNIGGEAEESPLLTISN